MRKLVATILLTLCAAVSHAGVIDWTDWTASDLESATGTVGGVGVRFVGGIQFVQLANGVMVGTGAVATTDYWIEEAPPPYTGNSVVDNRPPGFELVGLNFAGFNSLFFDAPVENPVMAIVSQGRANTPVTYDFDTPFTVLSEGEGFWGDGSFLLGPGNALTGFELHAVIQFDGIVSQINWDSDTEFWHGFTIGTMREGVPEPGTLFLLGMGVFGMMGARKRRS